MLAKQLIDLFQTHHYHFERGLVEAEVWDTWVTQFRDDVIAFPGFREVLEIRRKHLRPSQMMLNQSLRLPQIRASSE